MTLIHNLINKSKSQNQYEYGHKYCKPGSIMFPFDGDDLLIGRQAFTLLSAAYQKYQARFVYTNNLKLMKKQDDHIWKYGVGWSV